MPSKNNPNKPKSVRARHTPASRRRVQKKPGHVRLDRASRRPLSTSEGEALEGKKSGSGSGALVHHGRSVSTKKMRKKERNGDYARRRLEEVVEIVEGEVVMKDLSDEALLSNRQSKKLALAAANTAAAASSTSTGEGEEPGKVEDDETMDIE